MFVLTLLIFYNWVTSLVTFRCDFPIKVTWHFSFTWKDDIGRRNNTIMTSSKNGFRVQPKKSDKGMWKRKMIDGNFKLIRDPRQFLQSLFAWQIGLVPCAKRLDLILLPDNQLNINRAEKMGLHGVVKSQEKSHSTLRAKQATFTFWVDKS